jgi:hypothetical protein
MRAQRIRTGFHRAGLALAALVAIPGLISLWHGLRIGSIRGPDEAIPLALAAAGIYLLMWAIGRIVARFAENSDTT